MKIIFPDYYDDFECTASACRHNCCIGWEIDVDAESLAYYRTVPGELGKRLAGSISRGSSPHFVLGKDERCPFLNGENLCDIISGLGEAALCQICADHPRFRNYYSDRVELGLGLCCEAASELVLGRKEPVSFLFCEEEGEEKPADELEKAVLKAKLDVMGIIQDRSMPLEQRMERAGRLCGVKLPELSTKELAAFFLSLECLDEKWQSLLRELGSSGEPDYAGFWHSDSSIELEYEQLALYLVYRHFGSCISESCKSEAMGLALLSMKLLCALSAVKFRAGNGPDFAGRVELARMFSAEIEYSQENIDTIFALFSN